MDANVESRAKMQEADVLVQKVASLANPSRPPNVQTTKNNQAQILKAAFASKSQNELERWIGLMEETTSHSQKRLEELEPLAVQLVTSIKFIKETLSRESTGLANDTKSEEVRLAQAQKELVEVTEQIETEKREIQKNTEIAQRQVMEIDLRRRTMSNTVSITPEEESALASEQKNLQILEEKFARLIAMSDQNEEEFDQKHSIILQEIESIQTLVNEAIANNEGKQNALDKENEKTKALEQTMRELEKKLAVLRE